MNKHQDQQYQRRTKIVATLGPATDDEAVLSAMVDAGMNLARLNFSHGEHSDHLARMELVRKVAKAKNKIIGIIADLQGPKIRIASFKQGKVELSAGDEFILDVELDAEAGDSARVGVLYPQLINDVKANDTLLLDDGRLQLKVNRVEGSCIYTSVLNNGVLSNNKGINLLGGGLSAKALTEKDKTDLSFALEHQVDYVALSFVRHAEDVLEAKQLIARAAGIAGVISKIERSEALERIEEIIACSDAIMVARGDLAVEIGDAKVPVVQKEIIHLARSMDKPVITATQMMESMVRSNMPTRAEVSDVANAVLDNTDAVMLSEETAMGQHPPLVIEAMARTCEAAGDYKKSQLSRHRVECQFGRIDEAIAMATMYTANHCNVKAIIALTESGATPLWMSRIRTSIPIYGLSRFEKTLGKMTLYRGVYPVEFDVTRYTRDEINKAAIECLQMCGDLHKGDQVILTKGDHMGVGGGANAMKILVVGQVL
ncbi:MAG: pyruvate kinase [Coxiellaceae bacterium]|nr:pyruvate kinase [Coxiellaceae bacterium]